jgi:hypothetical protein
LSSEPGTENQITIDWDMPWQYAEFRGNVAPRTAVLIGYVLRNHEKTGLSPYQIYKLVKEIYIEYLPNFTPPTYDEIRTDLYVLRHVKPPMIKRVGIVQSTNKPYFSKILYTLTPEGKDPRYDYIWWDPFEVFKSQRRGKRKTKRARQFGLAGKTQKTQKEQKEEAKEAVEQQEAQVQEAETQTAPEKGDKKKKQKQRPAAKIEVGSGVTLGAVVDALIGSALSYFVSGDKKYIDGIAKELKSLNIALDIDYVVGKIATAFDDLDLEKLTVASDEKGDLKYPENTEAALRLIHDRLLGIIDPNNMTDTVANAVSGVLGEVEAGGFGDAGALVVSERIADALSTTDIANIYVALADRLLGTEAGTRYYLSVLSKLYKKYEAEPFGEQRDPRKIKVNAAINNVARTIYDKYFGSDKIKHLLSIMHSTVGPSDMGIDQYREYVNDEDTFVGDFKATIMTYE